MPPNPRWTVLEGVGRGALRSQRRLQSRPGFEAFRSFRKAIRLVAGAGFVRLNTEGVGENTVDCVHLRQREA